MNVSAGHNAHNCAGHPGFDDNGSALYEMANKDNFNMAVYEWELEPATDTLDSIQFISNYTIGE